MGGGDGPSSKGGSPSGGGQPSGEGPLRGGGGGFPVRSIGVLSGAP